MYTVKERIEETGGKDYSVFDVISPEGVTVASYSALDYGGGAVGVDNAEYDALEKRIELNAELRSKQVQNTFVSEVVASVNLEQETEALRQRIAELEAFVANAQSLANDATALLNKAEKDIEGLKGAIESALAALDPYLNANSLYTPNVLEAAGFLQKALDGAKPEPTHTPCGTCKDKLIIWQWGIDTGYAHLCPDCVTDYSIEQLESRKYKNVSKFHQYNCNVCKGEGKTWEKFLHGGAGEIVCRKCSGKGKIEEEIKSLTETELVHNHMINKAIEEKRKELGLE